MQNNLNELTTQVRRDILRMVHKVNSGHPGGSLGCAEFLVVLYNEIMNRKEALKWMAMMKIYSFYLTVTFHLFFTVF